MDNYEDIINIKNFLPRHSRMSLHNRAAQFAPFAALTGYDEKIKETSRLTTLKKEITEEVKEELDYKLSLIINDIKNHPLVKITYFIKDKLKEGGTYKTVTGNVIKINSYKKLIYLTNLIINIEDIIDIVIVNGDKLC